MRKNVLLAVAALLTIGTPGVGSAAQPTLSGPGVVWYASADALRDATRYVLQGTRLPDGLCQFDYTLDQPADRPDQQLQELAFDPATCRSLMERGTIGDITPKPMSAAAVTKKWHGWYEDPIALHVNDVTNGITHSPSSTCATPSGTSTSFSRDYQWLSASGWSLQTNNWTTGVGCPSAYSSSYANFRNGVFCAFITTNTYYNRNTITAFPGGAYSGVSGQSKSGGCNSLLSFKGRFE